MPRRIQYFDIKLYPCNNFIILYKYDSQLPMVLHIYKNECSVMRDPSYVNSHVQAHLGLFVESVKTELPQEWPKKLPVLSTELSPCIRLTS